MPTTVTKPFKSGNSQAVRLPKEMAYEEGVELTIVKTGDVITMFPKAKMTISEMLDRLDAMPGPPSVEVWNDEEVAERPGV